MKTYLLSGSLALLLLPAFALAAYNDVQLTSSAIISVGGSSITIGASEATLASITVDSSSFTVTLAPGSSIDMISADRKKFSTDATSGSLTAIINSCTSSQSEVHVTPASGTLTVTVTPTGTCDTSALVYSGSSGSSGGGGPPVASSGGSSSSGGGGGGGGGGYYVPPTPTPVTGNAALIAQLQQQIQALLAQIAALTGGSVGSGAFTRNLEIGSTGNDVKSLQMYLNSHGFQLASSGPGSPGNETTRFGSVTRAALVKLQKAAGITPAAGYFGPKTRSYVNAHP